MLIINYYYALLLLKPKLIRKPTEHHPKTTHFCLSWPLLGRSWALLGRSWALLGRSWPLLAALGAFLAALGPLLAALRPLLAALKPLFERHANSIPKSIPKMTHMGSQKPPKMTPKSKQESMKNRYNK